MELHRQRSKSSLDAPLLSFVSKELFAPCPALVRGAAGTKCDGQLYAWYSGGPPAAQPQHQADDEKCARFVVSSRLVFVNECYAESLWLLYAMLGWGSPPQPKHLNMHPRNIYNQKLTLGTVSSIASSLAESCLPDIYSAARERFEHTHRLAREYCSTAGASEEPCDLATSDLGRRLWTPLTGGEDEAAKLLQ